MRELAGAHVFGQFQSCGGERTPDLREEQRAHGEVPHTWVRRLAEGPGGRTERQPGPWTGHLDAGPRLFLQGGLAVSLSLGLNPGSGRECCPARLAQGSLAALSWQVPSFTLTLALQVACYSCTSGQWSSVCPLPAGHGEPGIAVLDTRIYVLGGRSHNRGSRTGYVHIYDVEKDCWEEGPQLDNSISGLAACVLTLPRTLLLEPPRGTPDRSQADPDFASEVMSVSDWEEFDNSSED